MNRLAIAIFSLSVFNCAVLAESQWDSNGSGNWSDASRWKNGDVPKENYQVRLTGTTYLNDVDFTIFEKISTVVLPGYSSVFTISNDLDHVIAVKFYGEGKVVKLGKGTLTVDWEGTTTKLENDGIWEVRDGMMFNKNTNVMYFKKPLAVYSPGVVAVTYGIKLPGLIGDGIISNATTTIRTISITQGATRANPCVFSGMFAGDAKFEYNDVGGAQQLTNPNVFDWISSIEMKVVEVENPPMGYLGFVKTPSVTTVGRQSFVFEYLGLGENGSGNDIFYNNSTWKIEYDSGPYGGLTLNNTFKVPNDKAGVVELILSGSNTTASTFNGMFSGFGTNVKAAYIKKTGTGTWNFTSTAQSNAGTVEVEKGTLGYASIAERGKNCSLGTASLTQLEYTGAYDENKNVPYAYLLGDGTVPNGVDETVATMNYTGSTGAFITNRSVVLKGAGRFSSDTAMLNWAGFTSASNTDNLLILGGGAEGCVARGVTNGVGAISVAKEGTGSWTLAGDMDFTGSLEARAGRLDVAQRYHWYKIIFKETWQMKSTDTSKDAILMLGGVGLFAQNNIPYTNIVWNAAADGKPSILRPGEACLSRAGYSTHSSPGREPINLFHLKIMQVGYKEDNAYIPLVLDDPSTWIEFVVRLPIDAEPITHYDIRAQIGKSNSQVYFREAFSWSIQGSCDGVKWDELDTVVSNKRDSVDSEIATYAQKKWYSTGKDNSTGWPIATKPQTDPGLTSVSAVGAGAGAKLYTDTPITANGVIYDANLGGGTIDGFEFGESPTVNIRNFDISNGAAVLPLVFTNITSTSLSNIKGCTVTFDGTDSTWRAGLTSEGLQISPPGTVVVIR